jgi:hypothetical protein
MIFPIAGDICGCWLPTKGALPSYYEMKSRGWRNIITDQQLIILQLLACIDQTLTFYWNSLFFLEFLLQPECCISFIDMYCVFFTRD